MIDRFVFKDVWQANNAKAEWDAIAAWRSAGDKLGALTDQQRTKLLSIVGYDGDRVCGTLTCQIGYLPLVRENMAFIQAFVVPEYREQGIVTQLVLSGYAAMARYALEHPSLRIGGIAARSVVRGMLDKPVGSALTVLVAYTEKNEPVRIRWFDHFRIDEDAARARDPRKAQQQAY